MNCKKMKHASKVGLLLLSLLFLIGAANALPASDKAPLSYTPDQIQAIASRILQGEIVSESEKIAADPLVQQLLPRDTNPPSTDQTWGPDGVGYSARDGASGATYFWDDILATGSEAWAGASSDDSYISGLPIGFTYPFYGTNYTTFNICANGFITFTGSPGYTTALPTTNYDWIVPQKGSSTANDNYKEIASRYMYQTLSNPTRLVVSFIDVRWFNSTYRADTSYTRTWQIVLYPDGRAQVNYRRLTTLLTGATYYGGIDDIGANGFDIIAAGTLVSGLTNYAIEYNPPCHNTLNHAPVSGTTGIAATPTLSWTNNSCVASSDVYLSTLQADVTNLAAGALVADHTAGTSYTPASPLLNNTVYYWRVVSRNSANATINSAVMSFLTIGATPMSGNYTIGGVSPSYATFTDAVNALVANSINGPVVFSVRPGTYSERITIPVLNGSSATNTVTFQKETAAVVLNGAGTTGATDATVLISGADYIIFDGIDVADPGTTDVEFGYWITNANATDGSSYNTIKNATITLNRTNANTRGIRQYYTTIPTSSTGANHYNKYLNLKISNARYGGYIYGYSTTYPDLGTEVGSTVAGTGNTNRFVIGSNGVDDIGGAGASYGLYMYYQNNASVHDIDVANVTSIGAVAYGVYAYYQSGNYNFYNNRVYNIHSTSTTTTNYAAYGYYGAHTSGYTYNIFNNFIYSVNSTSIRTTNVATFYMYGAYLTGSGTFNFDNNSVLLNQGLYNQGADLMYNSACLYTVTGTFNTRNNILYNKTPNQASTSKHYAYYRSSGTLTSDNNVYYVPNPTNGYTGYFNTDQATLANWQAASLVDAASWATNPGFVDDTGTDLHIAPNQSSTPVEGNGQVLAWVTTDIDGEARAMPRDIGADDGSFLSNTAPGNVAIVSPLNGEVDVLGSTTLNWTFGENTTDCDVYLSTNQTLVGNLDPTALVVEGQNVTSYDPPGNLNQGIWYYWKVVARNAATSETNAGPVWSFRTYIPPLSGTMTIGGVSPNFATFADAINAMVNAGVGAGGVTFNVRPGTYAERITVPSIPSITETSPVVFQREAGAVTVSGLGTSATNDAMIWLNGCDYVTFDGINVLDPGTSSTDYVEYGYYVTPFGSSSTDGANYNTVKNAMIQMHKVNTSSYGVRQYYVTTPTAQSGANSYNRYLNLKVTDTYYGVYLYSSSSTSFYDMNNEVGSNSSSLTDPNRFVIGSGGGEDIGNYGLYLYYGSNYNVHNIDVRGVSTASTSGTLYSMYVYYTRGTSTVNGCRVYEMSNSAGGINSTVYHRGMYLYPQSGHTLDVYNNMVYGFTHPRTTETTTQYVTPIYSGNSGILNFHHNTVAIGTGVGTGPSSSCWYIAGGAVTANNNIFYNNTPAQTTAKHYGIYRSSATSFTSNYNDIFVQNANGFTGYYAGDMTDMAAWRTASGQDANSIADNPMFVNETTNPHIGIASNSMVESAGTPLASITTDIEGDARNATTPDIGADEGVFNDPFSPSDATLTNVTTTSMVLGWQDNTTDELGFPVYMSTNGTDFTLYATTVPNVVSLPIGGLNIGTHYWFRVYAQLPGGPSAGYASANAWTLVYGANVGSGITMSASLVDPGYTTAVVNSITDNTGNPVGTYYRVLELNSGNYITNTGGLGVTPRTALGANWTAYNLTGLPLGASLNFVPIACNGGGVEATPAGQAFPLQLNNYAQSGGPDGGGYYFRTSNAGATYDWVDISATGTLVPFPSYDDNYAQVSLGTFTFPYYGTTVSGVLTVITNGNVQIGASTASSLTNYALPTTNLNAGALSLLWDDLIYTTGWGTTTWVKYQNINDQMFVITYNGYRYNVTTNTFLAQIVIYSDGRIKFQYNNAPNPAAFTSTIGIQGAQTGTLFTQYAVTDIGWPGNNFAIEFSQGVPPTTPSNPTPADLATGVALTPTLGWTSNGTTYDVYFGTDNPPATAVSMGQAGSTYSVVAPLAQNTLYYWKVVAHNATGEAPGAVWSFTTASAPSAPVVSLTYSGGNANLSWPASTGTVTGYRIYRYATGYFTPPATGTLLATNDAATLTYSDLGVNGQYYYRVTAFNAAATASAPRSNESAVLVPRFISNDPAYGTPWPRALGVNRDAAKTVK